MHSLCWQVLSPLILKLSKSITHYQIIVVEIIVIFYGLWLHSHFFKGTTDVIYFWALINLRYFVQCFKNVITFFSSF